MGKILVSACLLGEKCRYDGGDSVHNLDRQQICEEIFPFCPEVQGGLSIPREPAEIVGGSGRDVLAGKAKVLTASGHDVTAQYVKGARSALALCRKLGVQKALLKSMSPSCGASAIYDGTFSKALQPGEGVTAALLRLHGIEVDEV